MSVYTFKNGKFYSFTPNLGVGYGEGAAVAFGLVAMATEIRNRYVCSRCREPYRFSWTGFWPSQGCLCGTQWPKQADPRWPARQKRSPER